MFAPLLALLLVADVPAQTMELEPDQLGLLQLPIDLTKQRLRRDALAFRENELTGGAGRFRQNPTGTPQIDLANAFSFRSTGAATDVISTADTPGLECGSQCTFFMRVRTDTGNVAADRYMAKDDAASQIAFRIDTSAASPYTVRLTLCALADCSVQYTVTSRSGGTPSVLNLWTSVVVTINYSTQEAIVYVDGAHQVISIAGSFPGAWVDTTSAWAVSANSGAAGSREMSGWFDDFGIDPDYAWTPDEVYAWHNKRGSHTFPSGITVGTWCRGGDDDAGAGTTCTDASGNGRNWTISGSGTFAAVVPTKIVPVATTTLNRQRPTFVVLAQSNGGGRGDIADLGGSQDDEFPNRGRIFTYDNNGPIGTPNGVTNPSLEPWDVDTGQAAVFPVTDDASTGVGPILRTADRVLQTWTQRDVGVIPCALGNTNSYVFSVSHAQAVTTNLFGECEARWDPAAIGVDAEIDAIIVYQGENDSSLPASEADEWDFRWQAIVEGVRDDIGNRSIPVIFVVLPTPVGSGGGAQWETVRARQQLVCGKLDNCSVVQAPSGYMVDGIHQTTAAQLSLGDSLGDAVLATSVGQAITTQNTTYNVDTRGWHFDGCADQAGAGTCQNAVEFTSVADNSLFNFGAHYTAVSVYQVTLCIDGTECDDFLFVKGTNANTAFHQLIEFNAGGSVVRGSLGGLANFLQTGLVAANNTWIVSVITYDGTQVDGGDAGTDANAERFSIMTKSCPRTNAGRPVCGSWTDWTTTGTFNGTIPATVTTNALAFLTGGVSGTRFNFGGDVSEIAIFGDGKVTTTDVDTCIMNGTRAEVNDLNAMSGGCNSTFAHPILWLSYGDKASDGPTVQLGNRFSNAIGNSTPSNMEGASASSSGDQFFHGL